MLVLLPPSETKTSGGNGPPLDLDRLSFPSLNPVRRDLADRLSTLARDVPASIVALGLSQRQSPQVARNVELWTSPTLPALARYTGVLYDALDTSSLSTTELKRAHDRLAVASALFGVLGGHDAIPAYRFSAGSRLPGAARLPALWRPLAEPVLATRDDIVVDLRSGAYAALARVPDAISVRVVRPERSGARTVVSHHNKAHKGRLARALAMVRREPLTTHDVMVSAAAAGVTLEQHGERALDILVGD